MSYEDIPAGMELVRAAGWNQTEVDWKRFLESDPGGCFVADAEGAVCGTAATIIYDGKLAWIGMVLVSPRSRGRGIGTELVRIALEYLDSCWPLSIKLDATPQGQTIYERFGFKPECEIERWVLNRRPRAYAAQNVEGHSADPVFAVSRQDKGTSLEAIAAMDADTFGANRSALLRSVHENAPELTSTTLGGGRVAGYALGRHGLIADQMGPWAAENEGMARELLVKFLSHSRRESVIIDCLKAHPFARDLLHAAGFQFSRALTRMVRGSTTRLDKSAALCAILGPEFG